MSLFIPDEQEDRDLLLDFLGDESDVLVFAMNTKIYALDRFDSKPVFIKERSGWGVQALAYHEGRIWDGGQYDYVYNTLKGDKTSNDYEGFKSDHHCYDLCSYNGDLYGVFMNSGVVDINTGKRIVSNGDLLSVAGHGGTLYYGGGTSSSSNAGFIFNAKGVFNKKRQGAGMSLVNFDGVLYDGSEGKICETFSEKVVSKRFGVSYTGPNKDLYVRQFTEFNGRLLDCGDYFGIRDTFTGKTVVETNRHVATMCTVPRKVLKGYF